MTAAVPRLRAEPTRRALMRSLALGALGPVGLSACNRTSEPEPDPEPTLPPDPDEQLVIGQIISTRGRIGQYSTQISLALEEARIDVNSSAAGLFGQEVRLLPQVLLTPESGDLSEEIAGMADQGASAVIVIADDEDLIALVPLLVEHDMAIVSPTSTAVAVRQRVDTAGLLVRLLPTERMIAREYDAIASTAQQNDVAARSYVLIGAKTLQNEDLEAQLLEAGGGLGEEVLWKHLYTGTDPGDPRALAERILEKPPALVILNGGPECGRIAEQLHVLTEERESSVRVLIRLGVDATRDFAQERFAPKAMQAATGYAPGGMLSDAHVNMMYAANPKLVDMPLTYTAQAYDAVCMVVLAARSATAVSGPAIARELPRILAGSEECASHAACMELLMQQRAAQDTAGVSYRGRMGPVTLDEAGDPAKAEITTATWTDGSSLVWADKGKALSAE